MTVWGSSLELTLLVGVLVASFLFWLTAVYLAHRVTGFFFCQVCLAISSVWISNLFLNVLPPWVTVFLMGQSVTGGAMLARDTISNHLKWNLLPGVPRQLRKQATFFGFILGLTLGAIALVAVAVPTYSL